MDVPVLEPALVDQARRDVLTWLETNWLGAVQTLAAVAQVVTAGLIVRLTSRLAAATDAYAKSAKDQVDELRAAREASIRPYVMLARAHGDWLYEAGDTDDDWGIPLPAGAYVQLNLELENVGSGPATQVRGRLIGLPTGVELEQLGQPNISGVGGEGLVVLHMAHQSVLKFSAALPQRLDVELRYGDLLEREWCTMAQLHLLKVSSPDDSVFEVRLGDGAQEIKQCDVNAGPSGGRTT
jgi:hypothetical protein